MRPSQEVIEYVKEWTPKCANDIGLFSLKMLGIRLNKGQKRVQDIIAQDFYPINLLLTGNRFGKTTMEAIDHIFHNFYKKCGPGVNIEPEDWKVLEYKTFNAAPHSELTKIMIEAILKIARGEFPIQEPETGRITKNKSYLQYFVDLDGLNNYGDKIPDAGPFRIYYANKSATNFFTLGLSHGDNAQGRGYGFGTYDEFGRSKSPYKEIDDLIPRLQDYNGKLDIITTPDLENEETIAYLMDKKELAEHMGRESGWRFISGAQTENEFLSGADRDRRMAGMSQERRAQVELGELSLIGANYFDIEAVNKMFRDDLMYIKTPSKFRQYALGLDTSGSGQDWWAFTAVEITHEPWQVTRTYYDKYKQPDTNIGITQNILEEYKKTVGIDNYYFTMDKTNEAGSIYSRYFQEWGVRGFRFGTAAGTGRSTKAELLDTLRRAINEGLIISPPNKMLKQQLITYKGPTEDEKQTTDALVSLALAVFYPYKNRELKDSDSNQIVNID